MINRRSYWKLNNPSVFAVDGPPLVAVQFMAVTLKAGRRHWLPSLAVFVMTIITFAILACIVAFEIALNDEPACCGVQE